jgi:hypothetical protein
MWPVSSSTASSTSSGEPTPSLRRPGQPLSGQAHDEHQPDVVQDGVEGLAGEVGGHHHQYDTQGLATE